MSPAVTPNEGNIKNSIKPTLFASGGLSSTWLAFGAARAVENAFLGNRELEWSTNQNKEVASFDRHLKQEQSAKAAASSSQSR